MIFLYSDWVYRFFVLPHPNQDVPAVCGVRCAGMRPSGSRLADFGFLVLSYRVIVPPYGHPRCFFRHFWAWTRRILPLSVLNTTKRPFCLLSWRFSITVGFIVIRDPRPMHRGRPDRSQGEVTGYSERWSVTARGDRLQRGVTGQRAWPVTGRGHDRSQGEGMTGHRERWPVTATGDRLQREVTGHSERWPVTARGDRSKG